MKTVSLYILHYLSRKDKKHSFIHSHTFDIAVSLTKSGLPRILPRYFRDSIRSRNSLLIKYILTILNLYRVLPYPGKLKLSTITDPFSGKVLPEYILFIPIFFNLLPKIPFRWKWRPFIIKASGSITSDDFDGNSTSGILLSLLSLSRSSLWPSVTWFFTKAPSYISNSRKLEEVNDFIEALKDPLSLNDSKIGLTVVEKDYAIGRLAFKEEPGKVRVFAMVDIVTQWILNPLHQWIFSILKKIPQDATFDQEAGIIYLQKLLSVDKLSFSFDLSAATDRLPLKLQILLLNHVHPNLGDHWANLLVNRDYLVPNSKVHKTLNLRVRYACGQPMGALSSWAMLALTHHFIVQLAAYQAGNRSWFSKYLVLGDDVVIVDKSVADNYLKIMKTLKVGVNPAKSLISNNGMAEFAKRVVNSDEILSGLSLKEFSKMYQSWPMLLQSIKTYKVSKSSFLRFVGVGSYASGHIPPSPLTLSHRAILHRLYELKVFGLQLLYPLRNYVRYLTWDTLNSYKEWLTPRLKWGKFEHGNNPYKYPEFRTIINDSPGNRYALLKTVMGPSIGKIEFSLAQSFLLKLFSATYNWKLLVEREEELRKDFWTMLNLKILHIQTEKFVKVFMDTPLWSELIWGRDIDGKERLTDRLYELSQEFDSFDFGELFLQLKKDPSESFSIKGLIRTSVDELFIKRPGSNPDFIKRLNNWKDVMYELHIFISSLKLYKSSRNLVALPVNKASIRKPLLMNFNKRRVEIRDVLYE